MEEYNENAGLTDVEPLLSEADSDSSNYSNLSDFIDPNTQLNVQRVDDLLYHVHAVYYKFSFQFGPTRMQKEEMKTSLNDIPTKFAPQFGVTTIDLPFLVIFHDIQIIVTEIIQSSLTSTDCAEFLGVQCMVLVEQLDSVNIQVINLPSVNVGAMQQTDNTDTAKNLLQYCRLSNSKKNRKRIQMVLREVEEMTLDVKPFTNIARGSLVKTIKRLRSKKLNPQTPKKKSLGRSFTTKHQRFEKNNNNNNNTWHSWFCCGDKN